MNGSVTGSTEKKSIPTTKRTTGKPTRKHTKNRKENKTMRIYILGEDEIIEFSEGAGGNLTDEDIEAGYEDYIYYAVYDVSDLDEVEEVDGGMMLLTESWDDHLKRVGLDEVVDEVVKFAIGDVEYILL
jgi:hypothetical protein